MKKPLALGLAGLMSLSLLMQNSPSAQAQTFSDVPSSYWGYSYVQGITSGGYMVGNADGTFRPDSVMNYAEFTTMMVNTYYGKDLAVVKSTINTPDWWELFMEAAERRNALKNTAMDGAGDLKNGWDAAIDSQITRYDVAMMIYNLLDQQNVSRLTSGYAYTLVEKVSDSVDEHYQMAVATCLHYGFLGGYSDGSFKGNNTLSRVEGAVIFSNLVSSIHLEKETYAEYEDWTEEEESVPDVTVPEVTVPDPEPEVTEPEPEVTVPEVTDPEPEVTVPEVTVPEVTDPEPEVTVPEVTVPEVTVPEVSTPTVEEIQAEYVAEVFRLVNVERAAVGLSALQWHDSLMDAAQFKSDEMSELKYFDHSSPVYGAFTGIIKKFGVSFRTAGENIAWGQSSPSSVMSSWMNSSGHKANILSTQYTHIGIGYNAEGRYWTQQFIA